MLKDMELRNMSVETILAKWNEVKLEQEKLQRKHKRYRNKIEKLMINSGKNKITAGIYTATRTECRKESLSKSKVPLELWNKYKSVSTYSQISLKVNKKKKKELE